LSRVDILHLHGVTVCIYNVYLGIRIVIASSAIVLLILYCWAFFNVTLYVVQFCTQICLRIAAQILLKWIRSYVCIIHEYYNKKHNKKIIVAAAVVEIKRVAFVSSACGQLYIDHNQWRNYRWRWWRHNVVPGRFVRF